MRKVGWAGLATLLGLCTTTFASGFEIDTAGVRAIALLRIAARHPRIIRENLKSAA